jgi:phenylpyruvate tautomerase PptA (4-oxalocrotonate tautomerase family)
MPLYTAIAQGGAIPAETKTKIAEEITSFGVLTLAVMLFAL